MSDETPTPNKRVPHGIRPTNDAQACQCATCAEVRAFVWRSLAEEQDDD